MINSKFTTFEQSKELKDLFGKRIQIKIYDSVFIKRDTPIENKLFFGIVLEKIHFDFLDIRYGVKEYSNTFENMNLQLIKHETLNTYGQNIFKAFDTVEIDKLLSFTEIKGIKYNHITSYDNTVILSEGMNETTRTELVKRSNISLLDAKTKLLIDVANKGFCSF